MCAISTQDDISTLLSDLDFTAPEFSVTNPDEIRLIASKISNTDILCGKIKLLDAENNELKSKLLSLERCSSEIRALYSSEKSANDKLARELNKVKELNVILNKDKLELQNELVNSDCIKNQTVEMDLQRNIEIDNHFWALCQTLKRASFITVDVRKHINTIVKVFGSTPHDYKQLKNSEKKTRNVGTCTDNKPRTAVNRGTTTSCFIQMHDAYTNFPEESDLLVDDVLKRMMIPKILSPILDPKIFTNHRSLGTQTPIQNITKVIDYVAKYEDPPVPSLKREPVSLSNSMTDLSNDLQSPPINTNLSALWQVMGQMIFSMVGSGQIFENHSNMRDLTSQVARIAERIKEENTMVQMDTSAGTTTRKRRSSGPDFEEASTKQQKNDINKQHDDELNDFELLSASMQDEIYDIRLDPLIDATDTLNLSGKIKSIKTAEDEQFNLLDDKFFEDQLLPLSDNNNLQDEIVISEMSDTFNRKCETQCNDSVEDQRFNLTEATIITDRVLTLPDTINLEGLKASCEMSELTNNEECPKPSTPGISSELAEIVKNSSNTSKISPLKPIATEVISPVRKIAIQTRRCSRLKPSRKQFLKELFDCDNSDKLLEPTHLPITDNSLNTTTQLTSVELGTTAQPIKPSFRRKKSKDTRPEFIGLSEETPKNCSKADEEDEEEATSRYFGSPRKCLSDLIILDLRESKDCVAVSIPENNETESRCTSPDFLGFTDDNSDHDKQILEVVEESTSEKYDPPEVKNDSICNINNNTVVLDISTLELGEPDEANDSNSDDFDLIIESPCASPDFIGFLEERDDGDNSENDYDILKILQSYKSLDLIQPILEDFASSTDSPAEPDQLPVPSTEPKIIPIERKPPRSIGLRQMSCPLEMAIKDYKPRYRDIIMKRVMPPPSTPAECLVRRKIKDMLTNLVTNVEDSSWTAQFLYRMKENIDVLVNQNHHLLIDIILEYISTLNFNLDDLNFEFTPPASALPRSYQKIISLIEVLMLNKLLMIDQLERKVFSFNSKLDVTELSNLTYFYVGLVDHLPECVAKLRFFIYKCLYCYRKQAIPMVYIVLSSFPYYNIIPKNNDPVYAQNDPLVNTLIALLLNINERGDGTTNKEQSIKARVMYKKELLLSFLTRKLQYQLGQCRMEQFVVQQFEHLKNNEHLGIIPYCFIVIAKRYGYQWALKNILQGLFWPYLNDLLKTVNDTHEHDGQIIACLYTISCILKTCNNPDNVVGPLNQLCSILSLTNKPNIQQSVMEAILRLSRFGCTEVYNRVVQWKTCSQINRRLLLMMKTFVHRKSLGFWKSLQNNC